MDKTERRVIFSNLFVEQVRKLGAEAREEVRKIVARVIESPGESDHANLFPFGGGCRERKAVGGVRIVYCVCGDCRKAKEPHEDCEGGANRTANSDDTIFFRSIYIAF